MGLEKALDCVPRKVIWWALRKLGVDEWIAVVSPGNVHQCASRSSVGEGYSQEFDVKVGVYQGSVLRPFLFIIVLEALSCKFLSQVPLQCLFNVLGLWGKIHCSVCLGYLGYGTNSTLAFLLLYLVSGTGFTPMFVWCIVAMIQDQHHCSVY